LSQFLRVLVAGIVTFAITNIDDAALLTLLFARRVPARRIVTGQYIGFAAIVLVSLLGVWAAFSIAPQWIRALGLLPIVIAIKQIFRHNRRCGRDQLSNLGVMSIAIVTFSSGADNIAVYVPFFIISSGHLWLILAVYAGLVAVWCFASRSLGTHPVVMEKVDQVGHWIVPIVLIVLGVYVIRR
jgi:cadmium resistance protein CadD (predicted permease)